MLYFFFNDTATTEIYTLSLHDALPITEEAGQHRLAQETIIKQNKQTKKRRKGVETLGNGKPEIVTTESDKDGQHTLARGPILQRQQDRKSTRLNSSHANISYAVFCLK